MERRESKKLLKRVLVSLLTLTLVLTASVLPIGGRQQNTAYAKTEGTVGTVTLEMELKELDVTTSDKVALTIKVRNVTDCGVSGIQFNVSYPKQFDLIDKTVGSFFDNGVSFFGSFKGEPNVTETARPMFCGFGSHGTTDENPDVKIEFTDKKQGDLVTLIFEANQQLTQGQSYNFSIANDEKLRAFLLKTNDENTPETEYLALDSTSLTASYTPKHAGGTITTTDGTKITPDIDENGKATVKQQVIAAVAETEDPVIEIKITDPTATPKAQLEISKDAMGVVAEKQKNLTIQTDAGRLKFDKDAAASIKSNTGKGKLVINVEKDRDIQTFETIKDAAVSFEVTASLVDDNGTPTPITSFGNGNVEIALDLPSALANEQQELICWNYTDTNYVVVKDGRVEKGKYVFTTPHFSKYVAGTKAALDTFNETAKRTPGVTVSGTVTSWNNVNDTVIRIYSATMQTNDIKKDIKSESPTLGKAISLDSAITTNAKRFDQKYSVTGIANGEYVIAVYKPKHAVYITSNLSITGNTVQNIELYLLGDVTGDGKVNTTDVSRLFAHARGIKVLTGYQLACGDVTEDGKTNTTDVSRLFAHARGIKPL